MRFVVTGEWTKNRLLKLIVVFFLFYVMTFGLTMVLLFLHKMDLSYDSIVTYYRGSEKDFIPARTYQGLLEISHYHLFAMGMLMMTLTHLLLFVPMSFGKKAFFIFTAFISAFADEASSWLIRYVHPHFAYLKLAAFFVLTGSLVLLVFFTLKALWSDAPSAYTDANPKRTRGGGHA
jgi:hypothetical protein